METAEIVQFPIMKKSTEEEKGRTIRLPEQLWELLDEDARRCKRSASKQLEAMLEAFYNIADVNIEPRATDQMASVSAIQPKKQRRA